MEKFGVPSASIALIEGFKIKNLEVYGSKSKVSNEQEPVTPQTLFQAASISKPLTSIAILREVEAGNLSLDEMVNSFLESWKISNSNCVDCDEVTIRHLLSHSAGVTVEGFQGYEKEDELPSLLNILDGNGTANSGRVFVDTPVGKSFRYSGGGYLVLQRLLEDKFSTPFSDYMKENIFAPLGLELPTFEQPLPPCRLNEIAYGNTEGSNSKEKYHIYPELAAAGLWTNARDLALIMIDVQKSLNNDSGVLLSQNQAKLMLSSTIEKEVGLGYLLYTNYFSHSGWNEGYSSNFIAHKEDGYGLVVLTNANKPEFINQLTNQFIQSGGWDELRLS